jgi:quinol monooxygenase YgiN
VNDSDTDNDAIYLMATLHAQRGNEATVLRELRSLAIKSRVEFGCKQYLLHVESEEPSIFIVYEIWQSQVSLEEHIASTHFQSFLASTEPKLSRPLDVKILNRID